jgi:hypothetical protein
VLRVGKTGSWSANGERGALEVQGPHLKPGRSVWDGVMECGQRLGEEGTTWSLSSVWVLVARMGERLGLRRGE